MAEIDLKITELKNILKEVDCITNINFSDYAFSFLKRRTEQFMKEHKIYSDTDFIYKINKSAGSVDTFVNHIFVPDSELFRDSEMWNYFYDKLLPKFKGSNELKIYLPFSIGGEELHSLLLLLTKLEEKDHIEIVVSAVTDGHIRKIKKGEFNHVTHKSSLKNIELLNMDVNEEDVFNLIDKSYVIKNNYPNTIKYESYDFLKGKYINDFDIVFFRNKMIYFNSELKDTAQKNISRSLKKGGYLIIGACETLDEIYLKKFKQVHKSLSIYKKKSTR